MSDDYTELGNSSAAPEGKGPMEGGGGGAAESKGNEHGESVVRPTSFGARLGSGGTVVYSAPAPTLEPTDSFR